MQMTNKILENRPVCTTGYMHLFLDLLKEKGWEGTQWLADMGFKPSDLDHLSTHISYKQMLGFFATVPDFLHIPGLGLDMGKKLQLSTHGVLAYAVMASETYVKGFEIFRRYLKIRTQFIHYDLVRENKNIFFKFCLTENMTEQLARFYFECSLSGTFTFLTHFLPDEKPRISLKFSYPEPEYSEMYYQLFGHNVEFNCGENSLSIDLASVEKVCVTANDSVLAMAQKQCEMLLQEMDDEIGLAEKIRCLLLESPWYLPSQEYTAKQMCMSDRTLRRKLRDLGTSYKEILESVHHSLAQKYLEETDWTVDDIAQFLGYSEATNFKRAFKRWTGRTPSDFRRTELAH